MSTPPPPSTTTTPLPPSSSTFPFPREYSFPPFFTRQTNLTTHHAQLTKWAALVLAYCRHHRLFKLSLSGNPPTSTTTTTTGILPLTSTTTPAAGNKPDSPRDTRELFHNPHLNRSLSLSDIREVIAFLRKDGRAEYIISPTSNTTDGGGANDNEGGDIVWIYWRTPEEWASLVESWVEGTGQKGTVFTVYELVEGEGTRGSDFHGLDQELLLKALNVLVKRGKAQIFGQEDSLGVKFF
ncbi:ESCRT-II complex subunit-domain-containing protein [Parachaetomium inaequale]|uniref:ESCRT-II complex subunit VPS25 n=1 Tax=Parachaetomium inaequale TaxID=2588326 RepID=A0AAN6SN24_9PEZI|nr:ESCRT-II complex subunit-domain-containing protein [Parachaetomium inaequale]